MPDTETRSELGGFPSTMSALQASLAEEQAMANWLDDNHQAVTIKLASLKEAGQTATV